MKRLFTLAIVAMIASLTFAQAPVQKKAAPARKIEKVYTNAQMQKGMEAKAAFQAKAQAAQQTSGSVLRHAAHRPTATMNQQMKAQKSINGTQITRLSPMGQYTMSQFKNKKAIVSVQKVAAPAFAKVKNVNYNANAPRMATPKTEGAEPTEVVATSASAQYYAADGDWYVVLQNSQNAFVFDIVTYDPSGLELGHEYTLDDMDASYSYCMVGGSNTKYQYAAATFVATEGAYGNDYEAKVTLTNGDVYHVTYTSVAPETLDVEITSVSEKWYGEPDMDWFYVLSNANFEFRFDIKDQVAEGLELGHEYTLADMIASYSWGKNKATGASITYKSVSFKALEGANGTDYAVTVVDKNDNTYNITYTTVAPPEPTETVEVEFTSAETELVDASASQGIIQFVGAKDNGFEAYVAFTTNHVAGEYTFDDVYQDYTTVYLDEEDYTGVACADLSATVTDLGDGAYKAVVEYLGANAVLYKLTFNYGEAEESGAEVEVTKDANGIITSVTGGVTKTFTRSADGTAYYVSGSQMSMAAQSGSVTVVEDGDKVYIKNPITRYTQGSWVEGTKVGNTIVVSAHQPLAYNSSYAATISLRWGMITAAGSIQAADAISDNFVFEVEGDTWTLQGTAAWDGSADAPFMGAFWDDDNSATGYGDAATVLTYDSEYVAPSTDLVVVPAGADVMDWIMNATSVNSSSTTPVVNKDVKVAFVDNDVYVGDIFANIPGVWIKGTREGNTVTFKKLQYLGTYGGSYEMYFIGTDGNDMTDATATIADGKITFNESLLANAATDKIYYLEWLKNVVISAEKEEVVEPVITELTANLPYVNGFDTEAEQAEAAIYDANGDGKTFTFANDTKTNSTTARYAYSTSNNGDDYVVFPGMAMKAGNSYKVSVDARPYGASYPERIEIVAGTVAKASNLNITVLQPTDLATGDYQTLTAEFVPEADGVYYIALHAISDKDQFYLYTDNFSVKENNMNAPAVPSIELTADAEAKLLATVKVTAPATTLKGDAIDGNVTLDITRDGEAVKSVDVAAGASSEFVDEVPAIGTYKYTVVAKVGDVASDAVSASVYVGEDVPMDVDNLLAKDLDGKVGLTWDAPTMGAQGGIIIPENIRYNVYPVEIVEFWGMQFPSTDYDNPYATDLTETEATVDFDSNAGEQAYSYFAVAAKNAAGESTGAMASLLTGAPYELPMVENFPGGSLTYWWGVDYDDNIYEADGGLGLAEDGGLVFDAPVAGWIQLQSGKVSLAGAENAALTFDYSGAGLNVVVFGPNKAMDAVALSASGTKANISLAEMAGEPWVRFYVTAEFAEAGEAFINNIVVMDMVENDLEIAVSAPSSISAGESASVIATVKNMGTATAEDYSVKFYINDKPVATPLFEIPALATMETAEFEFTLETSIFDEAGDVTVKAEVVFAEDEKPETNTDEVVITVNAPSATPVASVSATQADGNVVIEWTVSENTASEVTEDFESYEIGITADGETMGPWTAKDGDKGYTYGWSSESIAWDYTGENYAFAIMNFPTVFGAATDIAAASGDQALMFMSVTNENQAGFAADDWFISPELPGMAQTISFKACPMTAQYGAEKVEVMASQDGQSWTKLATFNIDAENTWTECKANLAEGTKYFALHYVSNDVFALFIDDVTYTTGGGAPTGFNVYVDEVLVAACDADARSYTYEGECESCAVTAVYGSKESAPVSFTFGGTGINGVAAATAAGKVYNLNGVRMNVSNLQKGVYILDGKKVVK